MALQGNNVIELLSSEIEISDTAANSLSPSTTNLLNGETDFDYEKAKRKRIAKVLLIVTSIFVLLSCILLGVSLNMTKVIDEKVRNSNTLLNTNTGNEAKETLQTSKKINNTVIP